MATMPADETVPHRVDPTVWCVHSRRSPTASGPKAGHTPGSPGVIEDLHAWYGVARPSGMERPWTVLNMITSIDGSVSMGGTSGGLGNATDRRVLGALRSAAAVVLVGAGTASAERYGPPRKAGQRVAVVTNSGRLDPDIDLFTSGAGLAVTHEGTTVPTGIETIRAGDERVDLTAALRELRTIIPDGWAVVEGGPSLNGALLRLDLIDEINVTTAPFLAGGDSQRMITGAPETTNAYELVHQLVDSEQYVFSRWVRRDRDDRPLS